MATLPPVAHPGRCFGNSAQLWLDLQGQHDIAVIEREREKEIARRVRREARKLGR
jgi:plasmid maintenance system antidote protein VapI